MLQTSTYVTLLHPIVMSQTSTNVRANR